MEQELEHHVIELPGWPGVRLDIIVTYESEGKPHVYWPIRPICEDVLGVSAPSQITRLQNDQDFAPYLDQYPMQTAKGVRPATYIEHLAFMGWITNIQSQRVRPEMRENIRRLRLSAWKTLSLVILDPHLAELMMPEEEQLTRAIEAPTVPAKRKRGPRMTTEDVFHLAEHLEERLGRVELQHALMSRPYVDEAGEKIEGIVNVPFVCEHGSHYVIRLRFHTNVAPEIVDIIAQD